jgi:hypothetical protein
MKTTRFFNKRSFLFSFFVCLPTICFAIPNPASVLCSTLNYQAMEGDCIFPDGSRCEQWSFWRGECGKKFHICTVRGGTLDLMNKTPVCLMKEQIYTWQIKKSSESPVKQSEWTVVFIPYVSSAAQSQQTQ